MAEEEPGELCENTAEEGETSSLDTSLDAPHPKRRRSISPIETNETGPQTSPSNPSDIQCPFSSGEIKDGPKAETLNGQDETMKVKLESEEGGSGCSLVSEGIEEVAGGAEEGDGDGVSASEDSESDQADVDDLLEAPINEAKAKEPPAKGPHYKEKVVLKHRSTEFFEVLPEGWIEVTHRSGLPVYLHKASRVCSFSRPYFLGPGSVRNHVVPLAAVPCLHQSRVQEEEAEKAASQAAAPLVSVQTAADFRRRNLNFSDLRDYANKRFQFQTIRVLRFGTWSANRTFNRRKRQARDEANAAATTSTTTTTVETVAADPHLGRPALPSNVRLITVPSLDHHSKPQHKPFFINPAGKTSIAVLHEFVQKILKGNVQYEFHETRNAAHPYSATVKLSAGQKGKERMGQILAKLPASSRGEKGEDPWVRMGTGYGNSKKTAKLDAATKALEILMPGDLHFNEQGVAGGGGEAEGGDSVALFELLGLRDTRVVEMSAKAGQPAPFVILNECLKQHSAFGDTQVKSRMERTGHKQHVFHMQVGKHEVSVPCSNKKEGKQKASQAMLAKLLPSVANWGALLRLYGSQTHRRHQDAKRENNSVMKLQTSAKATAAPNTAILARLRQQMGKLAEQSKTSGTQKESSTARPPIDL